MDAKPTRGEPAGPDVATSDARGDSTRDCSPAPAGEPPLLDTYLPDYDVTEFHVCVVNADAETTWAAIGHGDLAGIPVVRALLLLRALPGRVRALAGGRPAPPPPPFTFDDMPRVGFELLAEHPGEIAFGFVGRPWRVGDERPVAIGRGLFSDFSDPGYTKIAFAIRAQPYGAQRTLVVTETRIAATDVRSRRLFALYWKLIGPFSALIRRAILRRVRSDAERAGSSRSGARAVRIDGEIVINRPVDEVFDFVADERNEPRYNPRLLRVVQISPGETVMGPPPVRAADSWRRSTGTAIRPGGRPMATLLLGPGGAGVSLPSADALGDRLKRARGGRGLVRSHMGDSASPGDSFGDAQAPAAHDPAAAPHAKTTVEPSAFVRS